MAPCAITCQEERPQVCEWTHEWPMRKWRICFINEQKVRLLTSTNGLTRSCYLAPLQTSPVISWCNRWTFWSHDSLSALKLKLIVTIEFVDKTRLCPVLSRPQAGSCLPAARGRDQARVGAGDVRRRQRRTLLVHTKANMREDRIKWEGRTCSVIEHHFELWEVPCLLQVSAIMNVLSGNNFYNSDPLMSWHESSSEVSHSQS